MIIFLGKFAKITTDNLNFIYSKSHVIKDKKTKELKLDIHGEVLRGWKQTAYFSTLQQALEHAYQDGVRSMPGEFTIPEAIEALNKYTESLVKVSQDLMDLAIANSISSNLVYDDDVYSMLEAMDEDSE